MSQRESLPSVRSVPQSAWEDTARRGLRWRERAEELEDAIEEFLLWPAGRKGHAAAVRELRAVLGEKP